MTYKTCSAQAKTSFTPTPTHTPPKRSCTYRCTGFDDKVIDRQLLAILSQVRIQLLSQLHKFVNPAVDGEVVVGHSLLGLQQPLGSDAPDLTVGYV